MPNKKLIEVALPLLQINEQAAKECLNKEPFVQRLPI